MSTAHELKSTANKLSSGDTKEKFARFGIGAKGFVYCLIGGLTAMTAFGLGGKKTGSGGALETLSGGTFGQILLILTAVGLVGFVFWRFYQAFADPEDKGNDAKGLARRFGYFSSGVFYCFLAFTTVKILLGSSSGGGSGSNETIVSTLLQETYGQILVGILGAIFAGKSIYQLYRALSGKFKDKVKESGLDQNTQKFVLNSGRVGYISRGIVIAIISFLTFRAAFTANSSSAGGTKQAFEFLQNEFGAITLGVIALGLFSYGVFMFIKARYREMSMD
ncbi:DUF1206 domain-containing protein [Fulvivirga sp. RKSG066]|uniref:DUF1206 domain-containing protein n=1 Tax=Fulvivirga aurantia TaxID=2529383 RepID=UPI0012BB5FD6|nr:DUF1206 domain-containing protein [Fulvivirga aurantia]MTI20996.1 DUF1206 domain-containing protein [Fulvivirga aurantia]